MDKSFNKLKLYKNDNDNGNGIVAIEEKERGKVDRDLINVYKDPSIIMLMRVIKYYRVIFTYD